MVGNKHVSNTQIILALPYYSWRSKEWKHIRYRINKVKTIQRSKEWKQNNYSKWKDSWNKYNQSKIGKEYHQKYYFKNKSIISSKKRIRSQKYYKEHLTEMRSKRLEYYHSHKAQLKQYQKQLRIQNKHDVIFHYSNGTMECKACSIRTFEILTLDHIFGNGNKHRKAINSISIWQWIKRMKYPKGYQILCYNCNVLKERVSQEQFTLITNELRQQHLFNGGEGLRAT